MAPGDEKETFGAPEENFAEGGVLGELRGLDQNYEGLIRLRHEKPFRPFYQPEAAEPRSPSMLQECF
jgi:hypothetical protein